MTDDPKPAADVLAEALARKAEGRRELAQRSFAEKIERMEALRDRLAPFKQLREARRAARPAQAASAHVDDSGGGDGSASATSAGSNS
jgi:hypothetical protein